MPGKLIFIVGPTAAGKTRLAVKLAKEINGEIVSCDSMQLYRGMPVLSQAPAKRERGGIKHHLVGMIPLQKEYNVADFRKKAVSAIDSIFRKGKTPVMVGGSGLYVKALIDGLFPSPPADIAFRKKMRAFRSKYGPAKLYRRLLKIDPDSAAGIHPNDARRIIRALEIHDSTGRTMTELKSSTEGLSGAYDIRIFGLTGPSRDDVYSAIESRVDRMFEAGAVREVRRLSNKRLSRTARAVLGFKEILGYLKGEYDLETARTLLKKNTRHFAKRQLAWFRGDKRIKWFYADKMSDGDIIKKIIKGAA